MKTPTFNSKQVVKIENEEQFNEIYHVLRSAQNGISLDEWLDTRGYPELPLYLEHSNSVFRSSIGITYYTRSLWTDKEYDIVSFEDACLNGSGEILIKTN